MANPGGFLAHLVKLVTTIICMGYLDENSSGLTHRAFQINLVHSILGMFRFGSTGGLMGKRSFREFYERTSNISEVIPFGIFASEISRRCEIDDILRQSLLLVLTLLPIVHEIVPKKERTKMRKLINHSINLQLMIITIACLQRSNWCVINLVISYIFNRYYAENFCDWFDVPYDVLIQYSLSFVEIFSLTTLNEL
ncbi:uncharacterized protein LOC107036152 [Diachasma alloeum]|uniref:uncharacterized protein LOC107036152 n=1 Tax=Diachasma alloeum TaxID=454923 RepID=UPI0007382C41|nr:uncharacterized protein LOC107036152 [Diachasma alloeum]